MINALMRLARILVAQVISWVLLEWGGISIPVVNISVGAVISGIFKYIREKFPKNPILTWLPL
jgi:hypothetical protein